MQLWGGLLVDNGLWPSLAIVGLKARLPPSLQPSVNRLADRCDYSHVPEELYCSTPHRMRLESGSFSGRLGKSWSSSPTKPSAPLVAAKFMRAHGGLDRVVVLQQYVRLSNPLSNSTTPRCRNASRWPSNPRVTSVRVGQDAGGISRCEEASLLLRLASEHSFPCRTKASTILPILAAHLGLKLHEEDPQGWEAVKAVFQRAQPWAVSDGGGGSGKTAVT